MKLLVFVFLVLLSSIGYSSTEASGEKKDFSVICAASKAAQALASDKFITDKAEKTYIVWNMIDKNIKTENVKNALKAIAASEPKQRVKLLKQSAAEAGLKNWNCSTVKFLF